VPKLSTGQLNYLNIGLMLVAAVAAWWRPFELFLFAYAFLGPLHYLTEISWLHDRKYFTRGRWDYLVLASLAVVIAVIDTGWLPGVPMHLRAAVTYIAFGSALVFVLAQKTGTRLAWFLFLVATSFYAMRLAAFDSIFSIMLPTIVHVFIFTGMFILVGALRERSFSGIASLVVFCGCAATFFVFGAAPRTGQIGDYVQKTYGSFAQLNYALMTPFSQHDLAVPMNALDYAIFVTNYLYQSPVALAMMGLIAFAYTYHYLNWFSKTSIIQWQNISRRRFAAIIAIWLGSIGLYLYDYRLGLRWLFFLSLTHVFLEFPLNHLTFFNIGKELKGMAWGAGYRLKVLAGGSR